MTLNGQRYLTEEEFQDEMIAQPCTCAAATGRSPTQGAVPISQHATFCSYRRQEERMQARRTSVEAKP